MGLVFLCGMRKKKHKGSIFSSAKENTAFTSVVNTHNNFHTVIQMKLQGTFLFSSPKREQWHEGLLHTESWDNSQLQFILQFIFLSLLKTAIIYHPRQWVADKSISGVGRIRHKNMILPMTALSVLFWGYHKGKARTLRQKKSELVLSCFFFSEEKKGKTSISPQFLWVYGRG